jgi:hypothetical protein
MRKVITFMLILLGISLTACTKTSEIQELTKRVESELATFNIEMNTNKIDDSNSIITITVELISKAIIDTKLATSSYGEEGIILIRIVGVEDNSIFLYSDIYDVDDNTMMLDVHLNAGDSLIRTMRFSRTLFHEGIDQRAPRPTGNYKIQVALNVYEIMWIDTGLFIAVCE